MEWLNAIIRVLIEGGKELKEIKYLWFFLACILLHLLFILIPVNERSGFLTTIALVLIAITGFYIFKSIKQGVGKVATVMLSILIIFSAITLIKLGIDNIWSLNLPISTIQNNDKQVAADTASSNKIVEEKIEVPIVENENLITHLELSGTVRDNEGFPVKDVTVTINAVKAAIKTDKNGMFSIIKSKTHFTKPYQISYTKTGYKPQIKTYAQRKKIDINIFLSPVQSNVE